MCFSFKLDEGLGVNMVGRIFTVWGKTEEPLKINQGLVLHKFNKKFSKWTQCRSHLRKEPLKYNFQRRYDCSNWGFPIAYIGFTDVHPDCSRLLHRMFSKAVVWSENLLWGILGACSTI